ncbi:MAG: hypothetical protein R6U89_07115, partial [Dehalococcoidia bacterium]
YRVEAFDPVAPGYGYTSAIEAAMGSDCLAVLVEHKVIKEELNRHLAEIQSVMRTPNIIRFYVPDSG